MANADSDIVLDILLIFKIAFREEVVKCSLLFIHGIKFIRLTMIQK